MTSVRLQIVRHQIQTSPEVWEQARLETIAQDGHLKYDPAIEGQLDWKMKRNMHYYEYCWLAEHYKDDDGPGYDGKDYIPPHKRAMPWAQQYALKHRENLAKNPLRHEQCTSKFYEGPDRDAAIAEYKRNGPIVYYTELSHEGWEHRQHWYLWQDHMRALGLIV